jgi:hypothetical protein
MPDARRHTTTPFQFTTTYIHTHSLTYAHSYTKRAISDVTSGSLYPFRLGFSSVGLDMAATYPGAFGFRLWDGKGGMVGYLEVLTCPNPISYTTTYLFIPLPTSLFSLFTL